MSEGNRGKGVTLDGYQAWQYTHRILKYVLGKFTELRPINLGRAIFILMEIDTDISSVRDFAFRIINDWLVSWLIECA